MSTKKHGIVTGAGKGIGLSTVKKLLENGYSVTAVTRSESKTLNHLRVQYGSDLDTVIYDLANLENIKKVFANWYKGDKTCFLVNNAAVRSRHKLSKLDYNQINNVLQINYMSPLIITKEYLSKIKQNKVNHSIISVTSIVGPRGFKDLSAYASSKGALESSMRSLAIEYSGKNVRINCVAPGFIKTSYFKDFKEKKSKLYKWTLDRTPMGRWGEVEEVADVVEFLVSKKSSYITGSTIYVDGGWSANA